MSVLILILAFMLIFYQGLSLVAGTALIALCLLVTDAHALLWALAGLLALGCFWDSGRIQYLTGPLLATFRQALPKMTSTEREALEAGDTWFEAELFRGKPDWSGLQHLPYARLSIEEQQFVEGPTEALCQMLDDWKLVHGDGDLPPEIWDFLKQQGFLGIIIPKSYGGLGFSALAHSTIVMKIASRSVSAAVTAMVPNSLGPAELLLHYGTEQQKNHYLPRLAKGLEIPCFALTGPEAGSDAGALPDIGVLCRQEFEGQTVLGIKLTFNKRYITLAPVATLFGLAFRLKDPEHLLGEVEDLGISLALIPASHPGVDIGRRHWPLHLAFMNGPIRGQEVFIPADWLIGGTQYAGMGWRMLMDCLSAGRAISLPALATATGKFGYRMTGAYARIRRQFKLPIGQFEGVQSALARIAANTYQLEACRLLTCSALDQGVKPAVVSAIAKYHMTELGREIINDAMDVHGGRAIILGPRNYLAHSYWGTPISITVEGANILTRNLMIFGQGAMRCHPLVFSEMEAAREPDELRAQIQFDRLLLRHVAYALGNLSRCLVWGLSFGYLAPAPQGNLKRLYQQLSRMSAALALVSDVAMLLLGGSLKRREALSARLGDVLSQLYLASAVLKYFEEQGRPASDRPYVDYCLQQALYRAQQALDGFFTNFPNFWVGRILRVLVFPWGRVYEQPADSLGKKLLEAMMSDNELRDRLCAGIFVGKDAEDPSGRVELAFQQVLAVAGLEVRVQQAQKEQRLPRGLSMAELMQQALQQQLISAEELNAWQQAEALRSDAMQVDDFAADFLKSREPA